MLRYILIGAGVAGIAAAEAIRSIDPTGSIQLLCEEAEGYYSRPGLAYYLTGEITESHLHPFLEADFQSLRVQRITAHVVRLHPAERQVELNGGARLPYDRLLIATGAAAAPFDEPGMDVQGVVKLDTLSDANEILRLTRRGRAAVVVGGGITALEIVEGLVARGVKTHYLLRGSRYWSNVLDPIESGLVEERLKEDGVKIHHHTSIEAVQAKKGKLVGVLTKDGKQIVCNILAVAIGVLPRKELAESAGIQTERGILVDEILQTNLPNIYAAGDVAQVFDPISGKNVLDSLWGTAVQQGKAVGFNMAVPAGQKQPYHRSPSLNVTRLAGLNTTIMGAVGKGHDEDLVGIARGDSESWRLLADAAVAETLSGTDRLRLLVGPHTLLGAVVMGDQQISRPLEELVLRQMDISPLRERLLQPGAPLAQIITNYWRAQQEAKDHAAQ